MSPHYPSPSGGPPAPVVHVLAGARQPEDMAVQLVALYRGAVYGRLAGGADLGELEIALSRGQLTGIVELTMPHCYRVYVHGACQLETTSPHVAAAEVAGLIERPGILGRLGRWLLALHDLHTTDLLVWKLADAAREVRA